MSELEIGSNEDWRCNMCLKMGGGVQIRTDASDAFDIDNKTGQYITEGWKNICNNCLFKAIVISLNSPVHEIKYNGRLSEHKEKND